MSNTGETDKAPTVDGDTDRPDPPTHHDVVDALRERIIYESGMEPTDLGDLAALVAAYNDTDSRASADLGERVREVLTRAVYADPRPTELELRSSVYCALDGKFDAMEWTGEDAS